jgi:glycosyltransferase involved in cell wall biosynthesis
MPHSKNKIAIISHSLGKGGAERFAGTLSFMLSDLGYEIHHIIINDVVDYLFSGKLNNLGKETEHLGSFQRKIQKATLLKRYLDDNQINTIIDNRTHPIFLRELFAKWIFGKRKLVSIIHSYHLKSYLPKSVLLAKYLYGNSQLVCVSKAIENEVRRNYGFKKTTTIYNPIDSGSSVIAIQGPENYMLFFGRLDEKVKNFSLMIAAFVRSKVHQTGFKLMIMGEGPDEAFIQKLIIENAMQAFIQIVPFQKNPFETVSKARFTLLTSHHEGFPLAIIESLALSVPVLAVDCKSGPSEIIQHEKNGLLVENHNIEALSNAIKRLVEDANLYDICKQNAIKSISHLSPAIISKQWQQILENHDHN